MPKQCDGLEAPDPCVKFVVEFTFADSPTEEFQRELCNRLRAAADALLDEVTEDLPFDIEAYGLSGVEVTPIRS